MQRFPSGRAVATSNALFELEKVSINPLELIRRHVNLDPGCLGAADQVLNVVAVHSGGRIFSAYLYFGVKYSVVTEWDRSVATLMLASDY